MFLSITTSDDFYQKQYLKDSFFSKSFFLVCPHQTKDYLCSITQYQLYPKCSGDQTSQDPYPTHPRQETTCIDIEHTNKAGPKLSQAVLSSAGILREKQIIQ